MQTYSALLLRAGQQQLWPSWLGFLQTRSRIWTRRDVGGQALTSVGRLCWSVGLSRFLLPQRGSHPLGHLMRTGTSATGPPALVQDAATSTAGGRSWD